MMKEKDEGWGMRDEGILPAEELGSSEGSIPSSLIPHPSSPIPHPLKRPSEIAREQIAGLSLLAEEVLLDGVSGA